MKNSEVYLPKCIFWLKNSGIKLVLTIFILTTIVPCIVTKYFDITWRLCIIVLIIYFVTKRAVDIIAPFFIMESHFEDCIKELRKEEPKKYKKIIHKASIIITFLKGGLKDMGIIKVKGKYSYKELLKQLEDRYDWINIGSTTISHQIFITSFGFVRIYQKPIHEGSKENEIYIEMMREDEVVLSIPLSKSDKPSQDITK